MNEKSKIQEKYLQQLASDEKTSPCCGKKAIYIDHHSEDSDGIYETADCSECGCEFYFTYKQMLTKVEIVEYEPNYDIKDCYTRKSQISEWERSDE